MFYLVHINLPFWEILESNEDSNALDEAMLEYRDVCGIFEHELDIFDEEGMASLRQRHPQARTIA